MKRLLCDSNLLFKLINIKNSNILNGGNYVIRPACSSQTLLWYVGVTRASIGHNLSLDMTSQTAPRAR